MLAFQAIKNLLPPELQDVAARCLLRDAAFQLRDRHDNPVPLAGVALRLGIQKVPGSAAGGTAPEVELGPAGEAPEDCTDDGGRVFWDEVRIIQGTGAPETLTVDPWRTLGMVEAKTRMATEDKQRLQASPVAVHAQVRSRAARAHWSASCS